MSVTSSKDRLGVTQQPIATSNQWSICITHSYINYTNWFIKVIGRTKASYEHWIEKSTYIGDPIRKGTDKVTAVFASKNGLRLSMVTDPWERQVDPLMEIQTADLLATKL